MALFEDGLPVDDDLVSFDRNHLSGTFVHKVFNPCLQHPGSQPLSDHLLQVGFSNLYILRKVKYL